MKKIYAYAHTHWDREWYQSFESYRVQLLGVLKQILSGLENGDIERFYLDGQAVLLEDAVAIAPELEGRIKELMQKGRLSAGPWYVLPDEMLVCGESLIRNLKVGTSSVNKLAQAELVGYSPDTFGHSQDLPRILSGFGINSAFLWRGVPDLELGPCFYWQSPDGSQVLAYHLSRGYYQTALIESAPDQESLEKLAQELQSFAEDKRQWQNSSLYERSAGAVLYPIGADHCAPPAQLAQKMASLNKILGKKGYEIETLHLHDFVSILEKELSAANTLTALLAKELRDNSASAKYGNAFLLPGVLSSRLYLKRENRSCERRLFRFAEPLFSFLKLRFNHAYPAAELDYALRLLLKNHPHDSICGCSVDEVHDEMEIRFKKIGQLLDPLLDLCGRRLSGLPLDALKSPEDPEMDLKRLRLFNSAAGRFCGVVPITWFEKLSEKALPPSSELQITESLEIDQLFAGWGRVPYYSLLRRQSGYLWVEDLPPFSEANISFPPEEGKTSKFPLLKSRSKSMDNGILKVWLDERSRLKVCWRSGEGQEKEFCLEHKFRDSADGGDTYNYDPLPASVTAEARLISSRVGLKGPLLASLILTYEIDIPESLLEENVPAGSLPNFKRASRKIKHEIETEVVLKRGSPILEFETKFLNQSSGHRLELVMHTGFPVHCSFSENHFSLLRRYHQTKKQKSKLPVEIGSEAWPDRFPAQRFFVANGQLFLNKGLPEYGVEGESVTMTLLRSVPMLSRGRIQTRGGGAGPHLNTPGAECRRLNKVSYAWAPLPVLQRKDILSDQLSNDCIIAAYELTERYEQEIFSCFSSLDDFRKGSLFEIENPALRFLSAYISPEEDKFFLRLLNVSNEPQSTKIHLDFDFQNVQLCRFDEQVQKELFLYRDYQEPLSDTKACSIELNFGRNEVKTLSFQLKTEDPEPSGKSAARSRKKRNLSAKSG
ncbi:MAG: hypothetical protein K2X27_18935 [Candidatus Obscuribacterales bacterium]|nr:hypothetical protein [Candidatus Obscuribacterales bacterium]